MKITIKQWSVLIFLFLTSTSIYGQKKLYWANKNPAQINVSNIDGTDTKTIITQNLPQYHILDNENGKIYWTDKAKNAVIQCNLDGSNQVEFIRNLVNPKGIYIDSLSQFYIVDDTKILVYSKFGVLLSTFIDNLKQPSDLIIYKGIAYWGNQEEHTIEFKPLIGGSKKVLITGANKVSDLDIHSKTNEIFYNSFDPNLAGIYKAGLDGKNIKRLTKDKTNGLAIDSETGDLFWGSNIFACIYKANINNSSSLANPIRFIINRSNPFRMLIDKKDDKIFYLDHDYGNFLFKDNLKTPAWQSDVIAKSIIFLPTRFTIDSTNKKIYWVNSHTGFLNNRSQAIMVANLDGTQVEELIKYPKVKEPFGISFNTDGKKIYWTDYYAKSIGILDIDGSNDLSLNLENIEPIDVLCDDKFKKLYWTARSPKKIFRSNFDGSNIEDLVDLNGSLSFGLQISYNFNKLFWTNQNDNSIYSAELNGSNITKVLQTSNTFNGLSAICIDEIDSKLYFTDNKNIYQSDIDGSNLKTLMTNLSPSGIFILNDKSSGSQDIESIIKLEVFPNPLISTINVRASSIMNSIEIFEMNGNSILKELNINKEEHSIDTENYNLISGIYIMKINTNEGNSIRKIFKL